MVNYRPNRHLSRVMMSDHPQHYRIIVTQTILIDTSIPFELCFICPHEDMSPTSILSCQGMSGHVGQCRQDTSSNSVLKTLSEGHFVDIRGICGHFMDICGHLRTCSEKLACPQEFLSFVLSKDMLRTCP
jgi:hypothetical protein